MTAPDINKSLLEAFLSFQEFIKKPFKLLVRRTPAPNYPTYLQDSIFRIIETNSLVSFNLISTQYPEKRPPTEDDYFEELDYEEDDFEELENSDDPVTDLNTPLFDDKPPSYDEVVSNKESSNVSPPSYTESKAMLINGFSPSYTKFQNTDEDGWERLPEANDSLYGSNETTATPPVGTPTISYFNSLFNMFSLPKPGVTPAPKVTDSLYLFSLNANSTQPILDTDQNLVSNSPLTAIFVSA